VVSNPWASTPRQQRPLPIMEGAFCAPMPTDTPIVLDGDTPRSVTRLPVDRLAHQIGVPVVSRVLLDHVHQDPP